MEWWNLEFQQVDVLADNFTIFANNFHIFASKFFINVDAGLLRNISKLSKANGQKLIKLAFSALKCVTQDIFKQQMWKLADKSKQNFLSFPSSFEFLQDWLAATKCSGQNRGSSHSGNIHSKDL